MFPYQNFRPSDLASLLVTNPYLQDAFHQFNSLQLQPQLQTFQPYPFQSNLVMNKNFSRNPPIYNQNQPHHKQVELFKRSMSHERANHLQTNLPINDEFFQQPFFHDSPQIQESDIWKHDKDEPWSSGYTSQDYAQLSNTHQRHDSGYQPSHDSSIDQFELMSGNNYSNSGPVEKYIRPSVLTKEEYEEMRREFEMNGRNVLDKDDDTWQKQELPDLEKHAEFPPLHLPDEDKLSQTWKISEEFHPRKNNNASHRTLYNGWGTKLEKNPFEDVSLKSFEPSRQLTFRSYQYCVFCKNNEESVEVFMSHTLKDFDGRTTCPRLRLYTCPICGSNGDNAHTLQYCPRKNAVTFEEQKAKAKSQRNLIRDGRWSLHKE